MLERWGRALAVIPIGVVCAVGGPAFAEQTKGRWFLGGSIAFRSTTEEIRNNAQLQFGSLGADGIPFTFDPGEVDSCDSSDPNVITCDPRPDSLANSDTVIQEAYQGEIHAGYSVWPWLTVQTDVGYFKADVGPISAFLSDHFPFAPVPNDPTLIFRFADRQTIFPLRAGGITQVPVTFTLTVPFRTATGLRPYVGAGIGKIFTSFDEDSDIRNFNERVSHMRIRAIANKVGRNIAPKNYHDPLNDARIPMPHAIKIDYDSPSEWHLNAGVEWVLSSRVGVVFDARYSFTPSGIRFDIAGHQQVDLLTWSEKIYRSDGSVLFFTPGYDPPTPQGAPAPNPLCFDQRYTGIGCDHIAMAPGDARVNPEGIDPFKGRQLYTCPARADFDRDGKLDICYTRAMAPSPQGFTDARGDVVIQGGSISLTAFVVSIGMRYHF